MESPGMKRTAMEPTLSFAEMLRTADPEILRLVKIPAHWFPKVHDPEDQAKLSKHQRERFLSAFQTLIGAGTPGQFLKIHAETHYHPMSEPFPPWHPVFLLLP